MVGTTEHYTGFEFKYLNLVFCHLTFPLTTDLYTYSVGITLMLFNHNRMVEELQRVLGFDWLTLFMQSGLHPSTVVLSMRILVVMLAWPAAMSRFREGLCGGGWLSETECVLQNRIGMVLGKSPC